MKQLATIAALLTMPAALASAAFLPVSMEYYGEYGQTAVTSVFRGDLMSAGFSSVTGLTIVDSGIGGGSSGVFTGFDLDFVFFDVDGDLSTTSDQYKPLRSGSFVNPGVVDKLGTSIYAPTEAHPGALFGLSGSGAIDWDTATLGQRDASYNFGSSLSVDSSHGWLSLGRGGALMLNFSPISIGASGSLYLFIGDVGKSDEFVEGAVSVLVPEHTTTVPTGGETPTGPATILPGQSLSIDASGEGLGVNFLWDLDGDGEYDDAAGPAPTLTYEYLTQILGLGNGRHNISVQVEYGDGNVDRFDMDVDVVVPEPATLMLLAVGGAALLRRRRLA